MLGEHSVLWCLCGWYKMSEDNTLRPKLLEGCMRWHLPPGSLPALSFSWPDQLQSPLHNTKNTIFVLYGVVGTREPQEEGRVGHPPVLLILADPLHHYNTRNLPPSLSTVGRLLPDLSLETRRWIWRYLGGESGCWRRSALTWCPLLCPRQPPWSWRRLSLRSILLVLCTLGHNSPPLH